VISQNSPRACFFCFCLFANHAFRSASQRTRPAFTNVLSEAGIVAVFGGAGRARATRVSKVFAKTRKPRALMALGWYNRQDLPCCCCCHRLEAHTKGQILAVGSKCNRLDFFSAGAATAAVDIGALGSELSAFWLICSRGKASLWCWYAGKSMLNWQH
jgi:hypothetical protein